MCQFERLKILRRKTITDVLNFKHTQNSFSLQNDLPRVASKSRATCRNANTQRRFYDTCVESENFMRNASKKKKNNPRKKNIEP